MQAPVSRLDRATARRLRHTRAGRTPPPRPTGSAPQEPRGTDPVRRLPPARTRRAAHLVAEPATARAPRVLARTADAVPENASSISDCTPAARAIRKPDARSETYSNNAVLPTPASPRSTSTELSPCGSRADDRPEPRTRGDGRAASDQRASTRLFTPAGESPCRHARRRNAICRRARRGLRRAARRRKAPCAARQAGCGTRRTPPWRPCRRTCARRRARPGGGPSTR